MKVIKLSLAFILVILIAGELQSQVSLQTKHFKLSFDQSGKLTEMLDKSANKNYLASSDTSFLLSVRRKGKIIKPFTLHWKNQSSEIILSFTDKTAATIKVDQQPDYISFELKQLTNAGDAELFLWGPYPTIIGDTIGKVVVVVHNK